MDSDDDNQTECNMLMDWIVEYKEVAYEYYDSEQERL